jgi:hypothetical protein
LKPAREMLQRAIHHMQEVYNMLAVTGQQIWHESLVKIVQYVINEIDQTFKNPKPTVDEVLNLAVVINDIFFSRHHGEEVVDLNNIPNFFRSNP